MAKRKIAYNKSEYPNSFKRQGAFPLDETSVKYSKDDLDTYAKSNDAGAYVGQIVTVVTPDANSKTEAETYVIYSEDGSVNRLVKESELLALDSVSTLNTTKDNMQYISNLSQADGKITASHKILQGTASNISVTATEDGKTTIKDIAKYEHSSTKVDTTANNLEYLVEVTQTDGTIAAKKKTLQGTKDNISITVGTDGTTVIKDVAKVEDTTYQNTDSKYVAKVTQTDGKIEYTKHAIEGADNISVTTSGGKTTIKNTAALADTAVNNKYVSEVDQDKGQITVSRRTILEDTAAETANNASTTTSNGSVEVITSAVKPTGDKGIIPKKRKIKGAKDISVTVEKNSSDITVQHTTSVTAKTATSQTANGTKLTNGGTFTISDVQYNAQGHVSGETSATLTLPQYKSGTGIQVDADATTTDVSNDYKVNLQTATTSTIGGVKIHKDTTGYEVAAKTSGAINANISNNEDYRAVEIDKDDKAFVYVPKTTWTNIEGKPNVFVIRDANSHNAPDVSSGKSTINGTSYTLNKHDICIVQCKIGTTTSRQYTSYVYNGSAWVAMDGNYSAANVLLSEDMVITQTFGRHTVTSGSKTAYTKGTSIEHILTDAFRNSNTESSKWTKPSVTFTMSQTGSQSAEVGTSITAPTATLSIAGYGSYYYPNPTNSSKATGITFTELKITDKNGTATTATKSGSTVSQTSITATHTSVATEYTESTATYSFSASATYGAATNYAYDNLGKITNEKMSGDTLTSGPLNVSYTGFRYWYYGTGNLANNSLIANSNKKTGSSLSLGSVAANTKLNVACRSNRTPKLYVYDDFQQKYVQVSGAFSSGTSVYVKPECKRSGTSSIIYTTSPQASDSYKIYSFTTISGATYKIEL